MEHSDLLLLNNYGVQALRRGDLSEAANILRQALQITRRAVILNPPPIAGQLEGDRRVASHEEETSNQDVPRSISTSSVEEELSSLYQGTVLPFAQQVGVPEAVTDFYPVDDDENLQERMAKINFDCEASMYLHSQGISIASLQDEIFFSEDPVVKMAIVSSALLYNLGLVHQLQGLYSVGYGSACPQGTHLHPDSLLSRKRTTHIACSLYDSSLAILQSIGVDHRASTGVPIVDFLALALLNNVGYAEFILGDWTTSQKSFRDMEKLTDSIQTNFSHWDEETSILVDRYMTDFLLNKMVLQKPTAAPTA